MRINGEVCKTSGVAPFFKATIPKRIHYDSLTKVNLLKLHKRIIGIIFAVIYKLAVKITNDTRPSLNNDSHGEKGQSTPIYRTLYFLSGNEVSPKNGISRVIGEE